MVAQVPYFIPDANVNDKKKFFLPWPSTGRPVEDGMNDEYDFMDLRDAENIPKRGTYMSRGDQFTVFIPQDEDLIVRYIENKEKRDIICHPGKNLVVPPGLQFSCYCTDFASVKVLNRTTEAVGEIFFQKYNNKLKKSFTAEPIIVEHYAQTGAIRTSRRRGNYYVEESDTQIPAIDFGPFPGSTIVSTRRKAQNNFFTMEWKLIDDKTQVHFTGTGGLLEGQAGEPGVVVVDDKEIHVNLLLKRVDGSFYLEASEDFMMVVSKSLTNGEPDRNSLKVARFPKKCDTTGVKLPKGYWHSVPFPVPGAIPVSFVEIVSATNANCVINVAEETGSPIKIEL